MQLTEYTVSAAVPAPLRILLASDLHNHRWQNALDEARAAKPDLFALPGDLFDDAHADNALAFIREAASLAPVFCSLGNHDPLGAAAQMEQAGAIVLNNRWETFRGIRIGGFTSGAYYGGGNRDALPEKDFPEKFSAGGGFRLLLCHHPEYFPRYIRDTEIEMTLSGHAHGGQWCFFGQGIFAPGQGLFPRLTAGIYENRLAVTRGMADHNGIPRLFNPHEIVLLELLP